MPVDAPTFKKTLSTFASGVTVVGVLEDGHMRGMTASAFISVSLEPPLVLVSVAKSARMHAVLESRKTHSINILAHMQPETSTHFAGHPLEQAPEYIVHSGVPLLEHALARMVCTVVNRVDAGDHTLIISQVEYADSKEDVEPLLYYKGKYGQFSLLD